jgi:hypothetical protein
MRACKYQQTQQNHQEFNWQRKTHNSTKKKFKNFQFITANEYLHSSNTVCSTLWEVVM